MGVARITIAVRVRPPRRGSLSLTGLPARRIASRCTCYSVKCVPQTVRRRRGLPHRATQRSQAGARSSRGHLRLSRVVCSKHECAVRPPLPYQPHPANSSPPHTARTHNAQTPTAPTPLAITPPSHPLTRPPTLTHPPCPHAPVPTRLASPTTAPTSPCQKIHKHHPESFARQPRFHMSYDGNTRSNASWEVAATRSISKVADAGGVCRVRPLKFAYPRTGGSEKFDPSERRSAS